VCEDVYSELCLLFRVGGVVAMSDMVDNRGELVYSVARNRRKIREIVHILCTVVDVHVQVLDR